MEQQAMFSDYMRKISIKLLAMENRAANPIANSLQSNSAGNSANPSDPGSQGMQQVNNQGQSLNHPQAGQQILPPSIHNNIASSGGQGSAGISSALQPGSSLSQSTMPIISGQNSGLQNIQNISRVQPNSVGNSMGQGIPSNNFVSQRQIPGRQQLAPQPQQQPQNSQHYLYQQQLHQIAKQKLQQNSSTTSVQSHMQQQHQNLLQPSHFQPSQQSVMQPTMLQPSSLSTVQQNQQPIDPQSAQPVMQHHQQTVLRQQRQQQQASIVHQQQVLSTQQQQQQPNTMGQQTSAINLQHNQLIGQQSSYSEMQQQQQSRLLGQQSNISNVQKLQHHSIGQHNNFSAVHQQQLGPQSSSTGQQQQQHQLFGTQSGSTTMVNNQHSAHLLQSKVSIPQQNQPTQGQRSQPELQQQVMPQLQTQSGQLQHQLNTKLQPNLSQWDMQQRLPTSGAFQQQNVIDQQKQLFQQQRAMPEASSTSSDSTAQTGNPNGGDWQEEVYQKLKAMKDKYMPELNDMYQKIIGKLQQHDSLPQQPKGEQVEKLKMIKHVLERCMAFVQVPKSNITPNYKEKLGIYEKQIVNIISTHKRKPGVPPQQAQPLPPPHIHLTQENQMNPQMQSMNLQNNMGSLQHNSVLPSNAQQNMMSATQPTSNLDPGQNSTMNSLNINPLSSQGGMGMLQPNSSILQHQQLKQLPYRQMQQQYLHKQQLIQQQHQFQRQTKQQQQNGQLHMNQLPQLQPINDGNELKLRQQIGVKPEPLQQQQVASQRPAYHQQLKSGAPFSPQLLSASSPLTPQHSSPQIDQQNLLNSLTKSGTPLQSANSPFIVSSPSTTSTSHMPGESEKVNSGVSSLSNAGNIGHQPTGAVLPTQSLAIGTPGISASPLLAEFTSPDGNHGNGASVVSTKSSAIEQPIEHLLKVVKSISPKSLSASVSDIGSVVSMIDRIAGSAPGNGSRAAVGEDLVAMTKLHLQARTSGTPNGTRKMKRFTSAIPLNGVSSANSVNDSFKHFNFVEASELESTATSTIKRPRIERRHPLLEEIRDINLGLIDTVVDISKEDADSAEGGKGTIVKCSFIAVALAPNLKSQYDSPRMSPIQPLRLLVPANYPNCSPILLDKFPADISKEYEDLSVKAQWRFGSCVRQLSEPMSLEEMVRTWDVCARTVISEYAQQSDGGTFSTKYGAWEDCLTLTGTAA
ncbi:mediator of RNA polymerase II transcription subunit 15a-like isoform X3 [Cynara cardunculus var. scolymus]|uniref:mediator of RNA polymerase II transcription subunit 15a-like isoform X3 n=1 Tax=Cynara cardunculus var. scolymus TaxID=59895 RepID=UPI000D6267F7|nr:mediator of RNA polymerase II transcription subunit 15a-like isoform X3 [Cynara cardunculus var. scolymus]